MNIIKERSKIGEELEVYEFYEGESPKDEEDNEEVYNKISLIVYLLGEIKYNDLKQHSVEWIDEANAIIQNIKRYYKWDSEFQVNEEALCEGRFKVNFRNEKQCSIQMITKQDDEKENYAENRSSNSVQEKGGVFIKGQIESVILNELVIKKWIQEIQQGYSEYINKFHDLHKQLAWVEIDGIIKTRVGQLWKILIPSEKLCEFVKKVHVWLAHASEWILKDFITNNSSSIDVSQAVSNVINECRECNAKQVSESDACVYPILNNIGDVGLSIIAIPRNRQNIKFCLFCIS